MKEMGLHILQFHTCSKLSGFFFFFPEGTQSCLTLGKCYNNLHCLLTFYYYFEQSDQMEGIRFLGICCFLKNNVLIRCRIFKMKEEDFPVCVLEASSVPY